MGRLVRTIKSEKSAFGAYQHGAKIRNIFFDLEFHEFVSLIKMPCFYCGQESSRMLRVYSPTTQKLKLVGRNGIDRVNNDEGYITENCVPCCNRCNKMKVDMSLEEFFARISRIYRLHIKDAVL